MRSGKSREYDIINIKNQPEQSYLWRYKRFKQTYVERRISSQIVQLGLKFDISSNMLLGLFLSWCKTVRGFVDDTCVFIKIRIWPY